MTDPEFEEYWARRRTSFGNGAAEYAVGRPHYPREALEWALPAKARTAVDVGAGTGRLTETLLECGLSVTSVEPSEEMRAYIPSSATAIAANAESLPLDDASVDAVVVGQAWHWFDVPAAVAEAARVIKPGGALVLLWNLLDIDDEATRIVADIINEEARTDNSPDSLSAPFDPNDAFPSPEVRFFRHTEPYTIERIVAYAMSRSQAILMSSPERAAQADALRSAVPAEFDLHLQTDCWRATRA